MSTLLSVKLRVPIFHDDAPPGLEWLEGDYIEKEWLIGYFSSLEIAESIKEKIMNKLSKMQKTIKNEVSDGFTIQQTFTCDQLLSINIMPFKNWEDVQTKFLMPSENLVKSRLRIDNFYPYTFAVRKMSYIPLDKFDQYLNAET